MFVSVLSFVVVGDRRGVVCRLYARVLRERVVLPVLTGARMVVSVFIGTGCGGGAGGGNMSKASSAMSASGGSIGSSGGCGVSPNMGSSGRIVLKLLAIDADVLINCIHCTAAHSSPKTSRRLWFCEPCITIVL